MYCLWTNRFTSRDRLPLPEPGQPQILQDNNWFGERMTMMRNAYGYGGNIDVNAYKYAGNNPVNRVDPSGLEDFYVCERNVQQPGGARDSGCKHTDIYGSQSGEVYVGFAGPTLPPTNNGLPKGPGWQCMKLSKTAVDIYLGSASIVTRPKKFKWGPKAGKSCAGATSADILACLQAKRKPPGAPGFLTNCQTDVNDAATDCCLTGFQALSILPPNQGLVGPKY